MFYILILLDRLAMDTDESSFINLLADRLDIDKSFQSIFVDVQLAMSNVDRIALDPDSIPIKKIKTLQIPEMRSTLRGKLYFKVSGSVDKLEVFTESQMDVKEDK